MSGRAEMSSVSGRNGNCLDQVLPEKAESQSVFGQNLHGDAGSGGREEELSLIHI